MDDKVLMAALAGLLHDIGKFAQRAGEQVSAEWNDPKTKQDFGYQHALYTWHFVDKYLPDALKPAGTMAAFHHRPKAQGIVIQTADHLSAGERRSADPLDDPQDNGDRKVHPRQLQTIFCSLTTQASDQKGHEVALRAPAALYLPLEALSLKREVIFPGQKLSDELVWKKYESMWAEFCQEAGALKAVHTPQTDPQGYLESLADLLQRYTWCIPSAYFKAIPDVSLYDHSRMTAALAAILAKGNYSEGELKAMRAADQKSEKPVAILVGGDISGVQDFIYTISSKGAARTLRGRSFYLQLLTEAALRYVLARLDLPYTNVIYSGGGNFFLLAAPEDLNALPAIRAELSRILLKHHGTALYLALGAAPVPASGFSTGQLPKHWDEMYKALNRAKQQRYSELGEDLFTKVFALPALGGNPDGTCAICGDDQRKTQKWDQIEAQDQICDLCHSFGKEIGAQLPSARFLALNFGKPKSGDPGGLRQALAELGMSFQLLEKADQKINFQGGRTIIWALDDPEKGRYPIPGASGAHYLRYVANQVPTQTLDQLQDQVGGGFAKLGVLRIDVDNVGNLFKFGLGENATLSRMAALSSGLSLFFEGWVKDICARHGRDQSIYTVYTGGDDAFLLGPWDQMPGLARELAGEFSQYTALHPGLTLSAGMSFISGKYPIYQAAEDAGDALEDAKHSGKNAFHFLGASWKWQEFDSLEDKFQKIVRIVDEKQLNGPRAIIQTLRGLAEQKSKKVRQTGPDVWGPWQWRGTYLLMRMEEREKSRPELAGEIKSIREGLDKNNYSELNQWGTAARWAQLLTRNKKGE